MSSVPHRIDVVTESEVELVGTPAHDHALAATEHTKTTAVPTNTPASSECSTPRLTPSRIDPRVADRLAAIQWIMQASRTQLNRDSVLVHDVASIRGASDQIRARLGLIQLSLAERMMQFISEICDLSPAEHWDDDAVRATVLECSGAKIAWSGQKIHFWPDEMLEVNGCVWLATTRVSDSATRATYVLVGVFDTNSAGKVVEMRTCVDSKVCKGLCDQALRRARCKPVEAAEL